MTQSSPPPLEVICFSHLAWRETLFQRPHHWMSRFERIGPVYWLTPLSFRLTARPERLAAEGIQRSGVWGERLRFRHATFVPLSGRLEASRLLTNHRLAQAAREMLEAPGVPAKRRLVWLQYPGFIEAAQALAPDVLVVDVMDPYDDFPAAQRTGRGAVRRALERADLVLAGGHSMAEGMEWLGDKLRVIPSGVETNHFARAAALRRESPPPKEWVAGYAGSVDERIDWPLVEKLARALPKVVWEFAGPIRPGAERLKAPNVRYLGPIPLREAA